MNICCLTGKVELFISPIAQDSEARTFWSQQGHAMPLSLGAHNTRTCSYIRGKKPCPNPCKAIIPSETLEARTNLFSNPMGQDSQAA